MKLIAFALALSAATRLATTVPTHTPPLRRLTSACIPADDYTAEQIDGIKGILHSSDTNVVGFRSRTHLAVVPDTAIEVVSDSLKCAQALSTFNSAMSLPNAVSSLYLIRVGAMYVGSNPTHSSGDEFTQQLVMDSTFVHVATYGR